MNAKNLLLAGLVLLSVVLVVCLVQGRASNVFMMPAGAQNRAVSGGGYAATTANVTSSRQALWIVDNTEKTMLIYVFPATGKGLQAVDKRDLRVDFGADLAGEIMLIPGQVPGNIEVVYAIDPVGKRMVAYAYSDSRRSEILSKHDLGKEFKGGK